MIGVVDYEAGNIASVRNALASIAAEFLVSADTEKLSRCTGLILPGVGAAPAAMSSLRRRGLVEYLRRVNVPLLGICLGMQLFYERSEEGDTGCLGILPGIVSRLDQGVEKIPHMGWNRVEFNAPFPDGIVPPPAHFYFAHSYAAPIDDVTAATSECGVRIAAAVRHGNYFGLQFHPEKSGAAGLDLLTRFLALCESSPR